MKTLIRTLYLALLFLPQISFSSECALDSGHNHWAPRIGLLSEKLSTKVEEWGKENIFSEKDIPLIQKWRDALYLSGKEISQTFDLNNHQLEDMLIKPIDNELFVDNRWKGKKESFPRIEFFQGGYDIFQDKYLPSILQLNTESADLIKVDTNSERIARQCRSILKCSGETTNACEIYLDSWTSAVSAYAFKASQLAPKKIAKLSIKYEEEWSTFFRDARSQTVFDRIVTAALHRKELKSDKFSKPPEIQLFFLHPAVVAEYTGSAPNGDESGLGLSLEWLGINNWKRCPLNPFSDFKFGCGISAVSLYIDKSSVKSVRHGLMFHIDNHYSLGFVRERLTEGEVGIFLSLDLMKSFETLEGKISSWNNRVDNLFE